MISNSLPGEEGPTNYGHQEKRKTKRWGNTQT